MCVLSANELERLFKTYLVDDLNLEEKEKDGLVDFRSTSLRPAYGADAWVNTAVS